MLLILPIGITFACHSYRVLLLPQPDLARPAGRASLMDARQWMHDAIAEFGVGSGGSE
jgi:hypothetical protein